MNFSDSRPRALRLRRATAAALGVAFVLSGCASFEGIVSHEQAVQAVKLPTFDAVTDARNAWPRQDWWRAYGDPQLDDLMTRALADSPTLALARARLARARAMAGLSAANARPQLDASASLGYGRQSGNYMNPRPPLGTGGEYVGQGTASIDLSYDLDLWGRNAALIQAAQAQERAAGYDAAAARLALTTSVAQAYVQLAGQHELLDVLRATEKQRRHMRELIDKRVASGLDTRVEVKQAESNEAALHAERERLETAIKVTRLQLAALTGQMPGQAEAIVRPKLAAQPFDIPSMLPLDLLARRPELAAQHARIQAVLGEAAAAKARFYPNVNLSALVGLQAIGLGQLLEAGSMMNSVGPAIHLPIFDAGRLRANYAAKTADIDAAIAQYNEAVLRAAQDVAEQLTRVSDLAREEAATRTSLEAAEEALRLATLRYQGGLAPYLSVLTTETQVLAQRQAMSVLHSQRAQLQVALVRALGGGFNDIPDAFANRAWNGAMAQRTSNTIQEKP